MKRSNGKLRFLYIIFIVFFLAIIGNVCVVTLNHKHLRSNTSLDDYIYSVSNVEETIFASRGSIFDNNGSVLAKDINTFDIICYLDENRLSSGNQIAYVDDYALAAKYLAPILATDELYIYETLQEGKNNKLYQTELGAVGRNLSEEQVNQIKAINELHGIGFRNSYKRYYPYGSQVSPQLIGFAKSDETGKLIGQLGIEQSFNDELSGCDGYHSYQQDKNGYILPGMYEETIEAIDGYDIYLTLDLSVQEALNNCLETTIEYKNASRAWGAVVEINTGKILAWSQIPSFNPNNITSDDVQVNYGSQLVYEPGSVMKSIIYASAMDLGVYNGTTTFDSSPYCFLDDISRTYAGDERDCIYNVSHLNWGTIELDYGLIYSSNVATTTLLSSYVGVNNYQDYLDRFHLYQRVETDGIDELAGYTNYGLSAADCITATYGQGSSTTMIQLLQAYTSIFGNGEMLKPYFVDKIIDPNNNKTIYQGSRNVVSTPISEKTAKDMQALLRRVVSDSEGTCRHYEANTVNVMGKTGTSEIAIDGSYSESETIISCMLGFPYENPKYMVYYAYVSPETVYYNYDVKPVPELIDRIALLEGLRIDDSINNEDSKVIYKYEMPSLLNDDVDIAKEKLEQYNSNVYIVGDGDVVLSQYPKVHDDLYTNEKVFLYTGGNIYLPDFSGWTRKEVISYWSLSGLPIQFIGFGVAHEQSTPAGSLVDGSREIIIQFREINYSVEDEDIVDEIDD